MTTIEHTDAIPLIINSAPVTTAETFPSHSPSGTFLSHVSTATPSLCRELLTHSTRAYQTHRSLPAAARASLLRRAAARLLTLAPTLHAAMTAEIAAAPEWADFNIRTSHGMLLGIAELLEREGDAAPQPLASAHHGMAAALHREPLGVVLAFAPWNAPLILAVRAIAWPVAAGNAVVLVGSEVAPRTHFLAAGLFAGEGWETGLVSLVLRPRERAEEVARGLIEDKRVRKVGFTGGGAVGAAVAGMCARVLKPVLLELGGKAPVVVCEDAEMARAVDGVASGGCAGAGQVCMGTERVLMVGGVAREFEGKLVERVREMFGVRQGMVLEGAGDRCRALIEEAVERGAEVLLGGKAEGRWCENTVLKLRDTSARVWREETFAPIICLLEVASEDEAVELANDTEYGLSAAVWSRDVEKAQRIAARIEAGMVHINGSTIHDEVGLPHGGVKSSGYGRYGGPGGLDEWRVVKTVTVTSG